MSDPRKWMKNCLDKWSGNHKFGKDVGATIGSINQGFIFAKVVKPIHETRNRIFR